MFIIITAKWMVLFSIKTGKRGFAKVRYMGTITLVVVLSIILLEIALRILAVFPTDSAFYVRDPLIGHRMRPDTYIINSKTNSFGFNDIERAVEKSQGSTRIAFIGDSFVSGIVPRLKNFTFVIQELADRSGANIEVLNMGIAGAGPDNYLALLKNDAVLMKVDLACVVFFVGNDITQSHPDFKTQPWLGAVGEVLRRPYLIGFSQEYFYSYRALRATGRMVREWMDSSADATFTKMTYLSIEYQRSVIFKVRQNPYSRRSYSESIKILKWMAKEATKNNMRFFVVIVPDELQINTDLKTSLIKKYNMNMNEYDFEQPQRILTSQLKASGIKVLDLLPLLLEHKSPSSLYANRNTHWNEDGNRFVAEKIWTYISDTVLCS